MQAKPVRGWVVGWLIVAVWFGSGPLVRAQKPRQPSPQQQPATEVKDPFVEALLEEIKPQKPDELLRAIGLLLDRRRAAVAKSLLQRLSRQQFTDAQLAQFASRHGLDFFFRLARTPELAPEGEQFYRRVLAAVKRHTLDPKRLAQAAGQLTDPSPQVRYQALQTLVQGRDEAAAALLRVVEKKKPRDVSLYRDVLLRLGEDARGPVVAVASKPRSAAWPLAVEVAVRNRWSETLPWLLAFALIPSEETQADQQLARRALVRLLGRVPTRIQAITLLYPNAERYFAGELPARFAQVEKYEYWLWESGQLKKLTLPKEQLPAWLAREVLEPVRLLSGPNRQVDRLYLACRVELLRLRHTAWEEPLPAPPGWANDPQQLLELLRSFDRHPRIALHAGALELLAHCGNAKLLAADPQGNPSPVARLLQHPHPRVRYAALHAVASWKPQEAFAGCHRVPQVLAHFSLARGQRMVLLGMRNTAAASRIAGVLRPLGFEVVLCRSARELLQRAVESPDCELVLLDPYLPGMRTSQLIQRLRADYRTAGAAVATILRYDPLAPGGQAQRVPGVPQFVPTESVEDAKRQVERLLAAQPDRWPNLERRLEYAKGALGYLAAWMEQPPAWLEVAAYEESIQQALRVPALNAAAAGVLARWGTHRSQRALLDVVNQSAFPLAMRQACAQAFAQSVQRHGVLLPPREILAQYERYNESAREDQATQKMLSGVLDVIEQWSKKRREKSVPPR